MGSMILEIGLLGAFLVGENRYRSRILTVIFVSIIVAQMHPQQCRGSQRIFCRFLVRRGHDLTEIQKGFGISLGLCVCRFSVLASNL